MDIAIVPASPYIPITDPTAVVNTTPAGESSIPGQYQLPVAPKLSL